jgi:deoxyribodipyrimidine photo-lyase
MIDFGENRVRVLNKKYNEKGLVTYWMSRDQRAEDNFALLFSYQLASERKQPLVIIFTLDNSYPGANLRHFDFMLRALQETEKDLRSKNYSLIILVGNPVDQIVKFIAANQVKILVTDFDPLKVKRQWKNELISKINIPVYEVDTHNIIPCWITSNKEEYGAYTIRPKIKKLLPGYLVDLPELPAQLQNPFADHQNGWNELHKMENSGNQVFPVKTICPGSKAAQSCLELFINERIEQYDQLKNDPNYHVSSGLSPYLHFGQISAQRIAIEIVKKIAYPEITASFLEELIVRKELADNFCFYNPGYDSIDCFKDWAKKSLDEHAKDEREYIYNVDYFENSNTHDLLWNAAQQEMVKTGKMHGYMRMYWAKKILEWTINPSEALKIANYLNDKYSLDGRDPNGYCGTAWSVGGIHDRAWSDRSVFGKIRYMNYNGCKRKFDVDAYISRVSQIQQP